MTDEEFEKLREVIEKQRASLAEVPYIPILSKYRQLSPDLCGREKESQYESGGEC